MKVTACIEGPVVIKQSLDQHKADTSDPRALPENRAPPAGIPQGLFDWRVQRPTVQLNRLGSYRRGRDSSCRMAGKKDTAVRRGRGSSVLASCRPDSAVLHGSRVTQ